MNFIKKLLDDSPLGILIYRILAYPHPYRVAFVRLLLMLRPTIRPHYRICMYEAAKLARTLGYDRISVIEFGVAGGNGLLALEKYAPNIAKKFNVEIDIYGFDMGDGLGLPSTQDVRDMPYFWSAGFYKMDQKRLESRLKRSRLLLGDIRETIPPFMGNVIAAPIGAVFVDVDYYTSCLHALGAFSGATKNWLPRVLCYFDDIEVCNEFQGEKAAIRDFNSQYQDRKIARSEGHHEDVKFGTYSGKIYTFHDFSHEKYNAFAGEFTTDKLDL